MNKGLPTFVRRDAFTGPSALARHDGNLVPSPGDGSFSHEASGSREHFFHFLIGYLLPLVHAQSEHRFEHFLALDCGPLMTPILHETLTRLGHSFTLVQPRAVERPFFVDAWDHGWSTREVRKAVENARALTRQAWRDYACPGSPCPRSDNLLLQRSKADGFYLHGSAELPGYGTSRRGITNLHEISAHLARHDIPHAIYEPGVHCLGCQIDAFSASRRLLGFRGAEWANLIWSLPSVRVRMLDADPPARLITDFMTALDIGHEFAIVDTHHCPEDPREALRFFDAR